MKSTIVKALVVWARVAFLILYICHTCHTKNLSQPKKLMQNINNRHHNYCEKPRNFPLHIQLVQQTFHNWGGNIIVNNLWTAIPKSLNEILHLTNWAAIHGYKVRALGFMHSWSPLTITNKTTCRKNKILLVNTKKYLTRMKIISTYPDLPSVRVQTGTSLDNLLKFLENNGLSMYAFPAIGDISIGGAIAIGGHGGGVPVLNGETLPSGFTYGSMSNLIISFRAIVWNNKLKKYIHRKFERSEKHAKIFLTHLGRIFLFEVTLRVGLNYNLRCLSYVNIPASELFSAPRNKTVNKMRTIDTFLDSSGRLQIVWWPFTPNPWLKIWTVSPKKPSSSKEVISPYNYQFFDNTTEQLEHRIKEGEWDADLGLEFSTATFLQYSNGLERTNTKDIWGLSKNVLLTTTSTVSQCIAFSYAIIVSRLNIQTIIHSIITFYQKLQEEYLQRDQFPLNFGIELRVTGLDNAEDIEVPRAESPTLSPISPIEGYPELNTALWFEFITILGNPFANSFIRDMESYIFTNINDGINAIVRPEWSKTWAVTKQNTFSNITIIRNIIPKSYKKKTFIQTVKMFEKYDPFHLFSNEFLELLMNK